MLCFLRHRQHGGNFLPAGNLQQVDDGRSAGLTPGFGNLVAFQAVHAAQIREEHDLLVRAGHEHLGGIIRLLDVHAGDAASAAVLRPVRRGGNTLYIALMCHGHDHVLFLDQILDIDIVFRDRQLAPALITVLVPDLADLRLDHFHQQVLVSQDRRQPGDGLFQLLVFLLKPFALQAGQAGKAHVENGLGLLLGKRKAQHQGFLRGSGILAGADDGDDLVDMVQCLEQAFQNMGPLLRLVQLEPCTPGYHFLLVLEVIINQFPQIQHPGLAVYEGQHVGAEVFLHGRMLEEHIQHNLRLNILLQFDDNPHTLPVVGFVTDIADALNFLFMHQIRNLLDEDGLVDLVGDFRRDDTRAAVAHLLDIGAGAHGNPAVAGHVGLPDPAVTHDQSGCREIRPLDILHEVFHRAVRIVDHADDAVDNLLQVMRRNVRGHPDGDTARAVHQEVRETRRQHGRLLHGLVKVRVEIHRILVDSVEQVHGQLLQAGFRITHGGRAVPVHGAEVALPFDQGITNIERLGQADHRVVHG